MANRRTVAACDLGSSKVCVLVGQVQPAGYVDIVGVGEVSCAGIKRGIIVDIEQAANTIRRAVQKAEQMSGVPVHSVTLGLSGSHIGAMFSSGVVATAREDKEITIDDISRATEAARLVPLGPDQQVVHVIPRQFLVDGFEGIRDPTGMVGSRLEVQALVVTGSQNAIQNVIRTVERAGLAVDDIVLSSMAAGRAVLSEAEREAGTVVIDAGAGTTDFAWFEGGMLRWVGVVPLGGDNITSDISVGLRLPIPQAEEIKKSHGVALEEWAADDEMISLSGPGSDGRQLSQAVLARIIQPRGEEILSMVADRLMPAGLRTAVPSGVVLTGGSAGLRGFRELAEKVYNLPVRLGRPDPLGSMADMLADPAHASAVGLLQYGAGLASQSNQGVSNRRHEDGMLSRIWEFLTQWF